MTGTSGREGGAADPPSVRTSAGLSDYRGRSDAQRGRSRSTNGQRTTDLAAAENRTNVRTTATDQTIGCQISDRIRGRQRPSDLLTTSTWTSLTPGGTMHRLTKRTLKQLWRPLTLRRTRLQNTPMTATIVPEDRLRALSPRLAPCVFSLHELPQCSARGGSRLTQFRCSAREESRLTQLRCSAGGECRRHEPPNRAQRSGHVLEEWRLSSPNGIGRRVAV